MSSCEEALTTQKYIKTDTVRKQAYEEGFKHGWYDRYLGYSLTVARLSIDTSYARGYFDGQIAYDCCISPLKREKDITCLKSLSL